LIIVMEINVCRESSREKRASTRRAAPSRITVAEIRRFPTYIPVFVGVHPIEFNSCLDHRVERRRQNLAAVGAVVSNLIHRYIQLIRTARSKPHFRIYIAPTPVKSVRDCVSCQGLCRSFSCTYKLSVRI
jgi:hypothetical protein